MTITGKGPAIRVIDELHKVGAEVDYYDPWIAEYRENGETVKGIPEITPEIVAEYDLVMITTAHSNVDYEMVQQMQKRFLIRRT